MFCCRGGDLALASSPGVLTNPFKLISRKLLRDGIADVSGQDYDGGTLFFFAVLRFNLDQERPF